MSKVIYTEKPVPKALMEMSASADPTFSHRAGMFKALQRTGELAVEMRPPGLPVPGGTIWFRWPGTEEAPRKVRDNTLTTVISPDVVIRHEAFADRLKESIILNDYPGRNWFVVDYTSEFVLELTEGGRSAHFVDPDGQPVAHLQPVIARDGNGETIAGRYLMPQAGRLVVSVPDSWLQSAVYPVVVDPTIVSDTSTAESTAFNFGRKLARDLTGRWWAAYARNVGGRTQVMAAYSDDDGESWTEEAVTAAALHQRYPSLAVDAAGDVHVVWHGQGWGEHASRDNIQYRRRTTAWEAQEALTDVAQHQRYPSIAVDEAGEVHVAWHGEGWGTRTGHSNIQYRRRTTAWGPQEAVTDVAAYQSPPSLAVDRAGNVHMMWRGEGWGTNRGYRNIQYRRRTTAWGPQEAVTDVAATQGNPSIAVDTADNVHVVWHGEGWGTHTSHGNIQYRKRTAAWQAQESLTDVGARQWDPSLAVDTADNVHVAWYGLGWGTHTSNNNIRYRKRTIAWQTQESLTDVGAHQQYLNLCDGLDPGYALVWTAHDGSQYSVEFLLVRDNSPPTAPTGLTRDSFDATTAARFNWMFNDPDSGDSQSAFQLRVREAGTADWHYAQSGGTISPVADWVVSGNEHWDMVAGVLTNGRQYEWAVMARDQNQAEGPWSDQVAFITYAAPTVIITYPATDGATHPSNSLTAQWSYSQAEGRPQASYVVKLYADDAGGPGAELWSSGEVTSPTARSRTIEHELVNEKSYHLGVIVKSDVGVWGAEVLRWFVTAFTPPPTPLLTVTGQSAYGRVRIEVVNPVPSGSEPTVTHNDLYRRASGASAWARIATGISGDGWYHDYAVASGMVYEYRVRAFGNNGTYADSGAGAGVVTLSRLWLHDVTDPGGTALALWPRRETPGESWRPEAQLMHYAGRSRPVAQFGEQEAYEFRAALQLVTDGQWASLRDLARRKAILCVRDVRGRRVFGVILQLDQNDMPHGEDTAITVHEVAYSEEI